jgi:GTP pyrophosphokinase
VDLAYQLHTDLGHRCRGAKVDGVMVPLDYPLRNAQRVEIIAAKHGGPSRDWLNPLLGYLGSSRARQKVRQWFSSRERDFVAQGRTIAEKELQRHGMMALGLDKLAARFKFTKVEAFFAALARGEITSRQLEEALRTEPETVAPAVEAPQSVARSAHQPSGNVLIVGVDKLLTLLAKCCKPVPPDPIIGFVTRGRGITIHRQECASLNRLAEKSGDRLLAAQWNAEKSATYPVDIRIKALDRQGLLGDIAHVLSREKVNVTATQTQSRDATAILQFTVAISDVSQLRRILGLIRSVPDVVSAERR